MLNSPSARRAKVPSVSMTTTSTRAKLRKAFDAWGTELDRLLGHK
jgi:hypothetical protein